MEYLTRLEKVKDIVRECEMWAAEGDDEMAHICEKQAWLNALLAVQKRESGCLDAVKAALSTRDISFARWYA